MDTLSKQTERRKDGETSDIQCQEEEWWRETTCTWTLQERKREGYWRR